MPALGRHLLAELCDCDPARLDDLAVVEGALVAAAEASGAQVLAARFHRFAPQGVSGVVLIAESHVSVHTWPEHAYAAVDFFTCGAAMRPEAGVALLIEALGARRHAVREHARGPTD
jgi:S-adenosylmethionine decarboxylase proenzyme